MPALPCRVLPERANAAAWLSTHPIPAASANRIWRARILAEALKEQGAEPGHHLVELDLCQAFGVSRTPIRGALKLLAAEGAITSRAGRGFVLAGIPADAGDDSSEDEEDQRLFDALAVARATGKLGDVFTQQEVVRRFDARLGSVMRVLRQLQELGLAERKPGNGWVFAADPSRTLSESYAFRRALEPQMLLQPGFTLDRAWADKARSQHFKLRKKPWRSGDGISFHRVNADFHEQLARGSGNRVMLKAVQRQNQLRQFLIGQWDYPMEQVRQRDRRSSGDIGGAGRRLCRSKQRH